VCRGKQIQISRRQGVFLPTFNGTPSDPHLTRLDHTVGGARSQNVASRPFSPGPAIRRELSPSKQILRAIHESRLDDLERILALDSFDVLIILFLISLDFKASTVHTLATDRWELVAL
jgi:hypothetical protein